MALFEELELWDNLIACYRLLQKKPQACLRTASRKQSRGARSTFSPSRSSAC